jgi:ribose 5-phosphate isomerase RpiB
LTQSEERKMKTFREIRKELKEKGIRIVDANARLGQRSKAYRIIGAQVNEKYLASAREIVEMYYNGELGGRTHEKGSSLRQAR